MTYDPDQPGAGLLRWRRAAAGAGLLRWWRAAAGAGLLLVLSNGPVLRFAGLLDRPGLWNDPVVWPFFAGAAAASAVLAWAARCRGDRAAGRARSEGPAGGGPPRAAPSRPALFAAGGYSAAALVSSLWSVYPSATLWRSAVYLGLIFLGLALAGFTAGELSTTIGLLAGAAVAGSLALIVVRHSDAVDRHGDWIGMYTNRNSLAPLAALGVIAGLGWLLPGLARLPGRGGRSATEPGPPRRAVPDGAGRPGAARAGVSSRRGVWGALLAAASLATLIGAGSRTAWLALAASLALATALAAAAAGAPRMRRWGRWKARAAVLCGALVAAGLGAAVGAAAWDVPTLAQRRTIWSLAWDRVQERPWGGYGFFAFWEVPELVEAHPLLQRGSAHNSLVETALGLGLLGTVPFAVLVVLAAVHAGRGVWLRPSPETWMWAAVTAFVLLENVTESFVLWFSHIWVLLLAAALRRRPLSAGAGF